MAKTTDPGPVAQRLRSLRRENGWTLAEVAERSGISKSTLSKLENGRTNLSFTTVSKLCRGLDLPISTLTTPHSPSLGARRSITRLGGGTIFQGSDCNYEILCDDLMHNDQVFMRSTVTCHEFDPDAPWRRHPGQEFILVLSGVLMLHTESYEPLRMEPGDSIVFDSSTGHKYVSEGADDAIILLSMQVSGYTDIEDTLSELNHRD